MHSAVCYGIVGLVTEPYTLSPKDAADLLGVHEDTLKRWAADGKVNAWKTPGGWWRFRRTDVVAILDGPTERVTNDPAA